MCRTLQTLIQTAICALQMVTRIFMTVLLMIENMTRMLLQSIYNFISTILQIISLIPICCVFMLTAKMRCLLCGGGGGGCGGGGGGGFASCLLSVLFFLFLFRAMRSYGLADKFMARLGYSRAWKHEGKRFTGPAPPTFPSPTTKATAAAKDDGTVKGFKATGKPTKKRLRIGIADFGDDEVKNYIFDEFETGPTTVIDNLQMAKKYSVTEFSKIGNLSTMLYYLF